MKNPLTRKEVVAVAGKPAPPPSVPLLPLLEMFLPKLLVQELLLPGLLQFWPQSVGFSSPYNHFLCPVSN
jgi:hypothetical protein